MTSAPLAIIFSALAPEGGESSFDAFELVKRDGLSNRLIDQTPRGVPERRQGNTLGDPQ